MDRPGNIDRRETTRHDLKLDIVWEADGGRKPGTLSDLSVRSCFVLCDGQVEDGAVVKLFFPLESGGWTEILATASNPMFEVGFAAKFLGLSEAQTEFIQGLIGHHAD